MNKFMKVFELLRYSILIGVLAALSGCSMLFDREISYEYVEPPYYPVVTAVGMAPISLQKGGDHNAKVLKAMRVSKLEAYRELGEQVYGLRLQGSSSVAELVQGNDNLKAKVDGVLRGAKVTKAYQVGDNYITEMKMDLQQVNLLIWTQNQPRRIREINYY